MIIHKYAQNKAQKSPTLFRKEQKGYNRIKG